MGVLRDRMIEEMTLRNFSAATQKSYVYAVSQTGQISHRSPDQLIRRTSDLFFYISRWSGSCRPIV